MSNQTVFTVTMGGPRDTDQIVETLGCKLKVNELITQENFPLESSCATWEDTIETIPIGRGFTLEEGVAILKMRGLLCPTYGHGIRFFEQNADPEIFFPRKQYILFPHAPWTGPDGCLFILYAYRHGAIRELDLNRPGYKFSGYTEIAGIRPH